MSICTTSFTSQEQKARVENFFKGKSTKGFEMALAQSLESIEAKAAWLRRDGKYVESWIESNGYLASVKSEL